ncbi:MAG: hypothetical protein EGQ48_00560 [Clostridiales bacterium]|nr:hypothetical protein [Clostridiales bacterium]
MKNVKRAVLGLVTVCAMLLCMAQTCMAAGISVTAGQSTVSVGRTVTITITVPSNAEVWLYNVDYSSNLTWVSGQTTMVEGYSFDTRTRVNQLVFRANDTGTGTVRISEGSYAIDGTNYDASGSVSVKIVSASEPDDSEPDYTPSAPGKSGNNALSALTVSAGTLTPAFDPAVTEYTLSLPQGTEKLTLTATPSDSNATVQGDGELTLQEGENTLPLVVTAENGDTKTYTVTAKVAQAPTLFLSFSGAKLGVVKDVEGVTPPTGFTAAEPVSQGGDTLPLWVDANGKHTLVYLVDEKGVAGFYLYSRTEGVLSPYLPLAYGGATYIYTGIPSEKAAVPGLKAATVEAFSQTLSGWRYEDAALSDFVVLYLMDDGGQYGYYTYDTKNATLQRFSGAVFTDSGETLAVPMLYVYIAGGAAALLLILMIVFACVSGSRGRKLRALASEQTEPAEEAAPEAQPEVTQTPEEEAETPVEEPTPGEEAEPAAVEPETSEEEAVPAAEPAAPEVPEPVNPEAAPTSEPAPTPEEAPPAQPEEAPTEDKSLEDTLRKLPLDDLLQDIRDL